MNIYMLAGLGVGWGVGGRTCRLRGDWSRGGKGEGCGLCDIAEGCEIERRCECWCGAWGYT